MSALSLLSSLANPIMAAVSLTYKLGCREELLEAEQSDH